MYRVVRQSMVKKLKSDSNFVIDTFVIDTVVVSYCKDCYSAFTIAETLKKHATNDNPTNYFVEEIK